MKHKILAIEDDLALLSAYKFMFRNKPYECYFAQDGEKGLKLALEQKPDVILIDLIIPLISGFKVIEAIREAGLKPYIIAVSNLMAENADKAKTAGADEMFAKTDVRVEDIVRKVEKILV